MTPATAACTPYICGTSACKTTCTANTDCAGAPLRLHRARPAPRTRCHGEAEGHDRARSGSPRPADHQQRHGGDPALSELTCGTGTPTIRRRRHPGRHVLVLHAARRCAATSPYGAASRGRPGQDGRRLLLTCSGFTAGRRQPERPGQHASSSSAGTRTTSANSRRPTTTRTTVPAASRRRPRSPSTAAARSSTAPSRCRSQSVGDSVGYGRTDGLRRSPRPSRSRS